MDDVASTDLSFAWDITAFTLTNNNNVHDASFYIDADPKTRHWPSLMRITIAN